MIFPPTYAEATLEEDALCNSIVKTPAEVEEPVATLDDILSNFVSWTYKS